MFGIGMPELIVILVVALLVLGPKRLPEVAKTVGKAMGELRRATAGVTDELKQAQVMLEQEGRKVEETARKSFETGSIEPSNPPAQVTGPEPPAANPSDPDAPSSESETSGSSESSKA